MTAAPGGAASGRAAGRQSRTITTDLFEQLRSDILHCRLAPGSRLRFKELRQRYSSGLSPLREALMRLVSEGLATLEDHKGFQVAPVSQDEMVDIATTLAELESVAVRKAIEHGDDRWEANIVARLHELSKRPITTGGAMLDQEWEARNTAFHEALYAACGSPSLIAFCRQLSERFSRYLRLWASHSREARDVADEHRQIMAAVIGRDAPSAVALLQRHRMTTVDELLRNWNSE